jgi:2-amino-4-hydroxy-6-hydroxymethyldihydropteridine diphosphokinase
VSLAYVGIGSNLLDPAAQVKSALAELARLPRSRLLKASSLYRTSPVGHTEQPDFVNAVASLETSLQPAELLAELQKIETQHGRQRSFKDAPRSLDLDLLLFDEIIQATADLKLPHPRMHQRAFVLKPLLEIAPGIAIPGVGPAAARLPQIADQQVERIP